MVVGKGNIDGSLMKERIACLNAFGNNLVETGNVLVQEREDKIAYYSALQAARGMELSVSGQGWALTRSTDLYLRPGNSKKDVQGR